MKLMLPNTPFGLIKSCILVILTCTFGGLYSQTFTPYYHWTFDGTNPLLDKEKSRAWTSVDSKELKNNQNLLGNYFDFTADRKGNISMPIEFKDQFSMEFWIKPSPEGFEKSQLLFFFNNRKAAIAFNYPNLQISTQTKTANGKIVPHSLLHKFAGTGKESLDYFLDDSWHHLVFQYQVARGIKEIWLDGELLTKDIEAPKGILCGSGDCSFKFLSFTQSSGPGQANYIGGLDEIALYNKVLPSNLIKQHYSEVKNGKHYSFTVQKSRRALPAKENSQAKVQGIDLNEYPKNHPNVKTSALQQLRDFPLARYKKGHQLNRNVNWMALNYFGGFDRKSISPEVVKNAVLIQEELAINWNYYLLVAGTRAAKKDQYGKLSSFNTALIQSANKYPHIPLSVITLWAQVVPSDIGLKEPSPRIYQTDPDFSLKNANRQIMDAAGKTGGKTLYMAPRIPEERFRTDGKIQAKYLRNILSELRRPIDLINENGETPFLPYPSSTLAKDPLEVRNKEKLKLKDWDTYQALQKNRLRMAYSQEFLRLPALKNTRFTWYGVDAGPQDRFQWKTARLIHTKTNGQYYSTPDFYVRWPFNWNSVQGPWRGWPWIEKSRKIEIKTGDKLFSPFVAAGWNSNPEKNVRPSQWLGLLKCLGPIGAEFFYTGYFNINKSISNPADYAWQAIIPAYAQAINSQYENLFRKGNVLMDKTGTPIIRLTTRDPRILATVRKLNKQYVLSVAIQPQSNIKGNVPDELPARLKIEGRDITCTARRQGSVYFLDLTQEQSPIFYQLDAWHQQGHPARWTKDFAFEAEVFDYSMEQEIHTERKPGAKIADFSSFDTYLRATDEKACSKYHFQPRRNNSSYQLRVRARCTSGSRGKIPIILDGVELGEIKNIQGGDWQWYELSTKIRNLSAKEHMLSLLQADQRVEIDKFVLVAK